MNENIENLIETIGDASYRLGQIVQMELISQELMKIASKFFSEGKDNLADIFREESRNMNAKADQMREEYDKTSKVKSREAWAKLDFVIPDTIYVSKDE